MSDGRFLLSVAIKGFVAFGVLAFVAYIVDRWKNQLKSWQEKKKLTLQPSQEEPNNEEKYATQQKKSREKIQEDHDTKVESYKERILKPKEEAKQKRLEEEFYRHMGPAWKGKGAKLGEGEDTNDQESDGEVVKGAGSARQAAYRRRLPEHVMNPPAPPPQPQKPAKVKIELPGEPAEGSADCVTVALRTPLGRTMRRRFYKSDYVKLLFDYMQTIGYHPRIYTLCQSYPRRSLDEDQDKTLGDVGITTQVMLNIEERDRES